MSKIVEIDTSVIDTAILIKFYNQLLKCLGKDYPMMVELKQAIVEKDSWSEKYLDEN